MGAEEAAGGGPQQVISVLKKVGEAFGYLQTRSENSDLAQARSQNNQCLHILILGGFMGGNPQNQNGQKQEINEKRGVFFTLAHTSRTFYHPDPAFTPNGRVGWLVRSVWKQDGLYQAHAANFPVVQSTDRPGFWWRQIAFDKGGGDQREGACRMCAKAEKDLENN